MKREKDEKERNEKIEKKEGKKKTKDRCEILSHGIWEKRRIVRKSNLTLPSHK